MELRSWGSVKSHSKASEDRPGKGNWRRDLGVREWGSAAIGSTGMMTWSTPRALARRCRPRAADRGAQGPPAHRRFPPTPSAGERVPFLREVTGTGVGGPRTRHQLRGLGPTKILRLPAASTEPAPRRGIGRTGNVPGKENTLPGFPTDRCRVGHRGDQSLGVGMTGVLVDLGVGPRLHETSEIHHRDPG